jgi:hypothetical protein
MAMLLPKTPPLKKMPKTKTNSKFTGNTVFEDGGRIRVPSPQMPKGYTPVNLVVVLFKPKSPSDSSESIKRERIEAIFTSTAQTGTPTSGRTLHASVDGGLCDGGIRNPSIPRGIAERQVDAHSISRVEQSCKPVILRKTYNSPENPGLTLSEYSPMEAVSQPFLTPIVTRTATPHFLGKQSEILPVGSKSDTFTISRMKAQPRYRNCHDSL